MLLIEYHLSVFFIKLCFQLNVVVSAHFPLLCGLNDAAQIAKWSSLIWYKQCEMNERGFTFSCVFVHSHTDRTGCWHPMFDTQEKHVQTEFEFELLWILSHVHFWTIDKWFPICIMDSIVRCVYEHERRFSIGWIFVGICALARSVAGRKVSIHELLWFSRQKSQWFSLPVRFEWGHTTNPLLSVSLGLPRSSIALHSTFVPFHFHHHFQIMWHRLCVCVHMCARAMQYQKYTVENGPKLIWRKTFTFSIQNILNWIHIVRSTLCLCSVCILMIFACLNIFDFYPTCARALHFSA